MIAVVTGDELAAVCKPWQTQARAAVRAMSRRRNIRSRGEKSAGRARPWSRWSRTSRAQAEDAIELIEIDWEELPAIASMEAPRPRLRAAPVTAQLATNLGLDHSFSAGDTDAGVPRRRRRGRA